MVVARIRNDAEIVEDAWEKCKLLEKDPVAVLKVYLQVVDQPPAVLLLGPIVKRENDKIRRDEEDDKENFKSQMFCEVLESEGERF